MKARPYSGSISQSATCGQVQQPATARERRELYFARAVAPQAHTTYHAHATLHPHALLPPAYASHVHADTQLPRHFLASGRRASLGLDTYFFAVNTVFLALHFHEKWLISGNISGKYSGKGKSSYDIHYGTMFQCTEEELQLSTRIYEYTPSPNAPRMEIDTSSTTDME